MKYSFFLILLTFYPQIVQSQDLLERMAFSIPKNSSYVKANIFGIEQLNIKANGKGIVWDCSLLERELVEARYVFDEYPDTNTLFTGNTFTLTAIEGGTSAKGYELYSMTDGAVLFRGFGMIDESGARTFEQFARPYPMLRFPWLLGEGYFVDHPFRASIRTLAAKGLLKLPNGETLSAYKVTESFEEGGIDIVDHFWYADSLPYPIMTITERYQRIDSSLISLSGFLLMKDTPSDINETIINTHSIIQSGNRIIIPFEHRIIGFYSLSGGGLSFSKHNDQEYTLNEISSGSVFLIYADMHGTIHTNTFSVLQ